MTNKGFDEYGHYGENNPPVGDTESYTEARMDDEPYDYDIPLEGYELAQANDLSALQTRIKELEAEVKSMAMDTPYEIVVDKVTDNEDGSAGITVTMSDQAQASVIELGLQFIFTCAAAKVDIQDALDGILKQGGKNG